MQKQTDTTEKQADKPIETEVAETVQKEGDECACESDKTCKSCEERAAQVEEYKMKYLRAIADYQNFERRIQDQRVEWTKNANKSLMLKLLTFLDDLERAELFLSDKNLAHVKSTFYKLLKNEGLEEIEVLNMEYDPNTAEVINMEEGKEDNIVIAVLRKGYTFNGQILRVAQVTVSKKS
ncbi:MAG: nucleotide exchange factor GrpE [Microgenomates group bacterium]